MKTHCRAIFVSYTPRLVNEDSDNRFVFRARHLRVHQFQPLVNCDPLGKFLNSFFNRIRTHAPLREVSRPKEKVGANPPDETPCFEQAVNYTERKGWKQPGGWSLNLGAPRHCRLPICDCRLPLSPGANLKFAPQARSR